MNAKTFIATTVRRIAGALAGAVAYGSINYGWDQAAFLFGWWSYPAWLGTGRAPLTLYALARIVGGACGLVGWRIIRRWGWKGLVGFLLYIVCNAALVLAIRLIGGPTNADPLARTPKPVTYDPEAQ